MIRLLIVDDSAFMRIAIRKMLESDLEIEVVGEAVDGISGVKMAEELRPDIITMDVEMPNMNGVQAVAEIMRQAPCSIIMVSSLTQKDGPATVKALALGAVDFVSKKSSYVQLDIAQIGKDLRRKIHEWYERGSRKVCPLASSRPVAITKPFKEQLGIVVVGVSTGGPAAVTKMLKAMKPLSCPMVIAQHMPAAFTLGFAEYLRTETKLDVVEGEHMMKLYPGLVVIVPGGVDGMVCEMFKGQLTLHVKLDENQSVHPSVDTLFTSVSKISLNVVAVILTGMGDDGTVGAGELSRKNKGPILAQEPTTCVVDGMPRSVVESGVATEILNLGEIAVRLVRWSTAKKLVYTNMLR